MKPVTIDNFDVKVHERYAEDQQKLDPLFEHHHAQLGTHAEIASLSFLYGSKWAELFEVQLNNLPWAAFVPPPLYGLQTNRFFTSFILPSFPWADNGDEEFDEEEKEKQKQKQEWEKVRDALLEQSADEQDRSALLHLVEQIKHLNRWLGEANARKLQYQKG